MRHVVSVHRRNELLRKAQIQGGVILRSQAFDAGFTASRISRCVASGEWQIVARGGYRLLESSDRLDLVRAAVTVLPEAIVSHYSAAALHRIPLVPTDVVSVSVPSRTTHAFPGVSVHRYDDLEDDHIEQRRGLPVTSPDRTLVDLARCLSRRHLALVVDEAVAENLCTIDGLDAVLRSVARKGKPGVASMRAAIEERSGERFTGTPLERRGARLLSEAGIVGFIQEFPVPWAPNWRFDISFPDEKVAIEWDSRRWHMQVDAMRRDRERDRMAVQHGWRILRFTWADVDDAPNAVIDTVRNVLTG